MNRIEITAAAILLLLLFSYSVSAIRLQEVEASSNNVQTLLNGLNQPLGLTVDDHGNLYFVEDGGRSLYKLSTGAANATALLSDVDNLRFVEVDSGGNLVFTSASGKLYLLPSGSTEPIILQSNLQSPWGVSFDRFGRVYFVEEGEPAGPSSGVMKRLSYNLTQDGLITNLNLETLIVGINKPRDVYVDNVGNVYYTATSAHTSTVTYIKGTFYWIPNAFGLAYRSYSGYTFLYTTTPGLNNAVTRNAVTLIGGLKFPAEVAVDRQGNIYFTEYEAGNLKKLSPIICSAEPPTLNLGATVTITGSVLPAESRTLTLIFTDPDKGNVSLNINTNAYGAFTYNYTPPEIGVWRVTAKLVGSGEENTASFTVTKYSTTISISISSTSADIKQNIALSGSISPNRSKVPVNILYRAAGEEDFKHLNSTETNAQGNFYYIWAANNPGSYEFKASWLGDADYAGSESETVSIDIRSQMVLEMDTMVKDMDGNTAPSGRIGETLLLSGDISNKAASDQPMLYIVQVRDSSGRVVYLSFISGTLPAGSKLNFSIPWYPEFPNTYNIEFFAWRSWSDPTPLSKANKSTVTITD